MGNLILIPADSYGMGILQQRDVVCTSRAVAEMFGKRHDNVIRDIENAASDLLKIEEIKEEKNLNFESVYIRVRPSSDPTKPEEKVAHFFDEKATSNFLIRRVDEEIFAEVHGRNEEPNTENLNLLEKARNLLVAIGGMIAGSKFQWKSLTEGLIKM